MTLRGLRWAARGGRKSMRKKLKKSADIRVGVIGYGGAFNMGKAHLQDMHAAGMTPAAVVEIDPAQLAAATADFPGIAT